MALWEDIRIPNYIKTVDLAGKQYRIITTEKSNEMGNIAIHGTHQEKECKIKKIKNLLAALAIAAALATGMGQVTASQEQSHNEWANSQPTYSQVYAQDAEGNDVRLTEEQAEQKEILDENVNSELYSQINSQNTGPVR